MPSVKRPFFLLRSQLLALLFAFVVVNDEFVTGASASVGTGDNPTPSPSLTVSESSWCKGKHRSPSQNDNFDVFIGQRNSSATCVAGNCKSRESPSPRTDHRNGNAKLGWVAKPLAEKLWGFTPLPGPGETSTLCYQHGSLYKEHLKRNSLWAVQMLDSSTLSAGGILSADSYHLGHYDECINTKAPPLGIRGQYCLAKIHFKPSYEALKEYYREDFVTTPFSLYYNPLNSAWTKIKETEDPSKKLRNVLHWAVCIPASCTFEDVRRSLEDVVIPALAENGIEATVKMDKQSCSVNTDVEQTTGAKIVISVLVASLLFVIIASTIDIAFFRTKKGEEQVKGRWNSIMLSYSIYENFLNLKKPDPSEEFAVLHGMRTYSMCLIILGHRCMFSYGSPFHNPEFLEQRYRSFSDMLLLNGTLIVDTFFVLSGFLTCYMLLLELKKRGKMDYLSVYIYRWTRIVPTYMFIIAFTAFVLPLLGNGPVWMEKAGLEAERCQNNWWTNFLFINNYVNSENLCMFQSWFISCDMHYFLIGMFLVHQFWKQPQVGILLIGSLLCIVIAIPFAVTYFGHYDGVLRVYMSLLEDPCRDRQYREVYIKSHNRAGPYMVGVFAAFLYYQLSAKGFRFSKGQVQLGGIVCAIGALSAMVGAWIFYIPGREYNALESALYASLHRILWSTSMSWIIITGGTTGYGVLSPILSLKALVPLSRLTYSVFLVHGLVQLYSVATIRVSEYITFPKLFWMWFGDVMSSFILALILHLLIEAPFSGIIKMVLLPKKQGKKETVKEKNNILEKKVNGEKHDPRLFSASVIDMNNALLDNSMDKSKMVIVSENIKTSIENKEL